MTISNLWSQSWESLFKWAFCLMLIIVLATNKFSGWLILKSENQRMKLEIS